MHKTNTLNARYSTLECLYYYSVIVNKRKKDKRQEEGKRKGIEKLKIYLADTGGYRKFDDNFKNLKAMTTKFYVVFYFVLKIVQLMMVT